MVENISITLSLIGAGMLLGTGFTLGALMTWLVVPNGKGLKEQAERRDRRLEELLQLKIDALDRINDTLEIMSHGKV